MRLSSSLALGALLVASLAATPALPRTSHLAPGPAQAFPTQWWVNGNGSTGTLEYEVEFGNQINGRLLGDAVSGFLQGRHLVLFREGRYEQVWEGWIMDLRGPNRRDSNYSDEMIIAGTYTDGTDTYPWFGTERDGGSSGRSSPVMPGGEPPQGFLDGASCQGIGGWVRIPGDANPVAVRLYADGPAGRGRDLGTVVANLLRSDLPFRDKNHGFSIVVPDVLLDGRSHAIYVYAIDSRTGVETLLEGSPKSIRCGG
jgi:hypothetical protein